MKAYAKAKVEVGVQVAERWIIAVLRHERFTSLAALNERVSQLVERINARPFKKLEGSRQSLFDELERPALRPLPATHYEFATWKRAKVNIDYHVEVDHHYYSVPYTLAGQVVDVRLSNSVVEVFAKKSRGQSPAQLFKGPSRHRGRPHARQPPSLRAVDAESHRRLGPEERSLDGPLY